MRPEWRWVIALFAAFAIGSSCAENFARIGAPAYLAIARGVALGHPWTITTLAVTQDDSSPGAVLRLTGEVRRRRDDIKRAATVNSRVSVGAAIETPLVFWTLLLFWPVHTTRRRLTYLCVGAPMFVILVAATTVCELLNPMAEASAILRGDRDPVTPWGLWARCLEDGGRFVVETAAALLAVAMAGKFGGRKILKSDQRPVDSLTAGAG